MGSSLKMIPTSLSGHCIVQSNPIADSRGSFTRLFCEQELTDVVNSRHIVQINYSQTTTVGAIRGLHFQFPPYAEMKLVRCVKGKVWDVAVDLRQRSTTFLQWHAEILTPENNRMMVIPEGFAHGFQVLEPNSELLYLHTSFYQPAAEGGIRFDDPKLGINWPLPIVDLSTRDASHPHLVPTFEGIIV
jgi:dTDP-4-dehydrorhamnose 3,5-epimerase